MVKVSVPNFFMCPISLQLMKDPVTLNTGQTYDRSSIEKWFADGHNTCPSSMQVLSSMETAPNHTLQRLIHQWCMSNSNSNGAALGVAVPLVPSTNVVKPRSVIQMLKEVANKGVNALTNLKEMKILVKDLDQGSRNRAALVEAGAVPVLANLVFSPDGLVKHVNACEEALGILVLLPLHDIRKFVHIGTKQLTAISWLLNRGSIDGRVNAAMLLGTLAQEEQEMKALVGSTAGIFEGLIQLLKEDLYLKAVDAGVKAILPIISNGPDRNITRAMEAGVGFPVVDRLLETKSKSRMQTLTKLMELLCSNPEGRKALVDHALVVPLLVKIILSGLPLASESAAACLWTICQHSPKKCVNDAAEQLCQVVESGGHQVNRTTTQRAAQLLQQLRDTL
ncbi:unnamed protein product [Calypogeia fissa]